MARQHYSGRAFNGAWLLVVGLGAWGCGSESHTPHSMASEAPAGADTALEDSQREQDGGIEAPTGGDPASAGDMEGEMGGEVTGTDYGPGSDKLLSDVTDEDARELCEFLQGHIASPTDEQACTSLAISFSETSDECEATKAACLSQAEPNGDGPPPQEDCSLATADEYGLDCPATIADLKTCIEGIGVEADAYYSSSCEDVPVSIPSDVESEVTPGCEALNERCPEFFEEVPPFDCGDGTEIPSTWVCDFEEDCESGVDEQDC